MAAGPEMAATSAAQAARVMRHVDAWGGGRPYLNFVEDATDVRRGYFPATSRRDPWSPTQVIRTCV